MLIVVVFVALVGAFTWRFIYGLCAVAQAAEEQAQAWRYSSSDDRRGVEP